jgi:hypothetical protein
MTWMHESLPASLVDWQEFCNVEFGCMLRITTVRLKFQAIA